MRTLPRRTLIGSMLAAATMPTAIANGQSRPASLAAPVVASPATTSQPDFATGVTLYVDRTDAEAHSAASRLLRDRANAGDSAICLVIPFTQDNIDSTRPRIGDELTPALSDLRFIVREAHRHGIATMLKPLMDERHLMETGPAGTWRGSLQPAQPNAWFATYTDLLIPWVELARDEGCLWFVIGSEFSSLEDPAFEANWTQLIARLRESSAGSPVRFTYGQNWDRVTTPPSWLAELDLLSVDAYFPLHDVDDGSPVDALVDAFQEHAPALQELRDAFPGKPLFFTEVGISSQSGVYNRPWIWGSQDPGTLNLDSQNTFLKAACQFYGSVGEGLFWWVAYVHPPEDPLTDTGFEFIGKPAEEVVNQCSANHREQPHGEATPTGD